MTALPLECQSAFNATVGLLRHPMVFDALRKLTVDNMIVDKKTSAILRVCAYNEMPWLAELCEHVEEPERSRDEPNSSRKRKEPERSHDIVNRETDARSSKGFSAPEQRGRASSLDYPDKEMSFTDMFIEQRNARSRNESGRNNDHSISTSRHGYAGPSCSNSLSPPRVARYLPNAFTSTQRAQRSRKEPQQGSRSRGQDKIPNSRPTQRRSPSRRQPRDNKSQEGLGARSRGDRVHEKSPERRRSREDHAHEKSRDRSRGNRRHGGSYDRPKHRS